MSLGLLCYEVGWLNLTYLLGWQEVQDAEEREESWQAEGGKVEKGQSDSNTRWEQQQYS